MAQYRSETEKPYEDCGGAFAYSEDGVENNPVKSRNKNTLHFPVINKVSLGKAIIKLCGNEGTSDDKGIRRLLQAVIDYIPTEKDQSVWKNAEVEIYDAHYTRYTIVSGNGDNRFFASYDERSSPIVVRKRHHIPWYQYFKNLFKWDKGHSK